MGTIWTNSDGLRVHFGTRRSGDEANFGESAAPSGSVKELAFHLRGSDFTSNAYTGPTLSLPAGVTVREVTAEVTEVFALGGTTPTINVGVSGSVGTNYLAEVSEAQAEALGVYNLTSATGGTLAANTPLAAASTITVGLDGTSPTVTTAGRLVIVVRYTDPLGA
jgi:hypothetical protein